MRERYEDRYRNIKGRKKLNTKVREGKQDIYIYIYIYIERERERESEGKK